jgi:hypothetical protein
MVKRTSRKYSRKISKKYSRKTYKKKYSRKNYKKKHKRTKKRKSKKILKKNLVGGDKQDAEYEDNYRTLLAQRWYGNEYNIKAFLDQKLTISVPENKKVDSENLKEVRIAAFTNYYRDSIYELVKIIDGYLGDLADVVVSGGDGLNNILESEDRLVSPDVDVKVIIKHPSVNDRNWLNVYRLVVVMTEYIVDYIVCCLNGNEEDHTKLPLPDPLKIVDTDGKSIDTKPNTIRELFYTDGNKANRFNFKIGDFPSSGKNLLDHKLRDNNFECIGNPWNRRTSNMKAGGNDTPFTLMNVKLIAIDLRYKGNFSYFGSLAGVLDIVIAVPGHVGHVNMLNGITPKGYSKINPDIGCSCTEINCINMCYYIYEMLKMIKYGLRTKNGKLYKDLGRCYTLLRIKKVTCESVEQLLPVSEANIMNPDFPQNLIEISKELITNIETEITEQDNEAIKGIMMNIIDKLKEENNSIKNSQQADTDFDINEDISIDPLTEAENENKNSEFKHDDDNNNRRDIDDGQRDNNCGPDCPDADDDLTSVCTGGKKRKKSNNRRKSNKQKGGGWKDENLDTVGKTLESLNILDFFNKCDKLTDPNKIKVTPCGGGTEYTIELRQHDKIYGKLEENFDDGIFTGGEPTERIDYEKLTIGDPGYEILCREPYMLYSYKKKSDNGDMLQDEGPNKFNTSRILTCPKNAKIMADILFTISNFLEEKEEESPVEKEKKRNNIKYLAQFRYFSGQHPPDKKFGNITIEENKLYAMFLYSSVIRGLNPLKLLKQKKRFKCNVEKKEQNNFKILHEQLIRFYNLIAGKAGATTVGTSEHQ